MNPALVILSKELKDGIRDRRAVLSAMLFPVLAPILVYFMLTAIVSLRAGTDDLVIPVDGRENAPNLVAWLTERGVTFRNFDGDPRAAVADQSEDFVLIIPDDYARQLGKVEPAVVELVSDSSRNDIRARVSKLRGLVRQYSNEIASLRLIARGVAPQVMNAVHVVDIEIASKQEITAAVLSFIPLYIVLAAFVAGMGIAVDSTAGERERRTLEYLLINPVERFHIAVGKWLAAAAFSAFGMVTTLVLCVLAMQQIRLEELGLTFRMSIPQVLAMILAVLPLSFFAPGLQMLVGIFAKSFKDAQSYIGILVIFPMLPGLYSAFNPIPSETWMFARPVLGQHLLLTDARGGKDVAFLSLVLAGGSTLLF
ncbi:MAG: ABC transporter permease, partial [Pseudomonadales bacterium]|nr:ABC transporter permease [Pseudomonadales bacterium]